MMAWTILKETTVTKPRMRNQPRLVLALCVGLGVASSPAAVAQADLSGFHVGPSKGEVIAAIVGAAAVVGVVVYFAVPRQKTIEGCIDATQGDLRLTSKDGKHIYVLDAGSLNLQLGQQVILKGKPRKKHDRMRDFQVRKILKDNGACTGAPHAADLPVHAWGGVAYLERRIIVPMSVGSDALVIKSIEHLEILR